MPAAPMPSNESQRLEMLVSCSVLDTEPEPQFDGVTHLARRVTDAPIALVSLVDAHRQWFKSRDGIDVPETPREHAICAHAILSDGPLVIPDTHDDPRTADNPLVTDGPKLRFYAGFPLVLKSGYALGTLCVLDTSPRTITDESLSDLGILAEHATFLLESRLHVQEIDRVHEETRTILDALPAYIYYKDADNTILDLNASAADAIGLGRAQIVGRNSSEFFPASDAEAFLRDDREVLASGSPSLGTEESHETPSGDRRIIRTDKIPLKNTTGRYDRIVAIASDITEARLAQELLAQKNEELERFVYTVSHDLKSPLLTIIGYAEMGSDDADAIGREGVLDCLERIAQAGRRLEGKIGDLLELSKLGRVESDLTSVDLPSLVDDVITSLAPPKESVVIQRGFEIESVRANPTHLTQVFQNLISNALRYGCGESGGVIEVGSKQQGDDVCLFVRDHGPGVPREHHARIFELFQRLSNDKASSGIGLSIVRRVAELYRGRAWIDSEPGQGATFWLSFPLLRESPRPSERRMAAETTGWAA